jgi:hypothetical protein
MCLDLGAAMKYVIFFIVYAYVIEDMTIVGR